MRIDGAKDAFSTPIRRGWAGSWSTSGKRASWNERSQASRMMCWGFSNAILSTTSGESVGWLRQRFQLLARSVRTFLTGAFRQEGDRSQQLRPPDVIRFVRRIAQSATGPHGQVHHHRPSGLLALSVRAGQDGHRSHRFGPDDTPLEGDHLPKSLKVHEIESLLRSCDRTTRVGKRDYAVLCLLARLGLRAGEIVAMTLDDIDWHAGELTIRGKGQTRRAVASPGRGGPGPGRLPP